ncbi:GH32 C-terminal domain-containing protein [Saccharicrinis sp. 156]|uniref:GH32 C-terminal domain-containing protein n=1 Tax=Saccharicrinis sp. 156 TaxID=3417574 RepID=UPI003D340773
MRIHQFIYVLAVLVLSCSRPNVNDGSDIHFSIGDGSNLGIPTELIYCNNAYHLFYQTNNASGNISWGHSSSTDLTSWEHLPFLNIKGDGSVVVDYNNTTGIISDTAPMIAISGDTESKDKQAVNISYSTDNGLSWKDHPENPMIVNDGSYPINDPKVFWHEETQRWIMLVIAGYNIQFYASNDLINWEFLSEYGNEIYERKGEWTNIDFFPVNVEESSEKKWVLFITGDTGAPNASQGTRYFTGDFDGFIFTAHKNIGQWLDYGTDTYLGVGNYSYHAEKDCAILMGCMKNSNTDSYSYTVPRSLFLTKENNQYYLISKPTFAFKNDKIEGKVEKGKEFTEEVLFDNDVKLPTEINLTFDVYNRKYLDFAEVFGVILKNSRGDKLIVGYHNLRRYFFIALQNSNTSDAQSQIYYAPTIVNAKELDVKVILTNNTVELFALNGFASMTKKFDSKIDFNQIYLFAEGGNVVFNGGSVSNIETKAH